MDLGLGLGLRFQLPEGATMISNFKKVLFGLSAPWILSSCFLEAPKKKAEAVVHADEYEKVVDSLIGMGSINPSALLVGQKDTRVETITISNSLVRELTRRELTVISADFDPIKNERTYRFSSIIRERDPQGNPAPETSFTRTTVLAVTPEGYYQFREAQGWEKARHSWDFILELRGFCDNREDENYKLEVTCSNMSVTPGFWQIAGLQPVPVRALSLIRNVVLTDKKTGEVFTSKLRHTTQVAPNLQEISKIVSSCVEGQQKIENQIYYLVRCNNLESL